MKGIRQLTDAEIDQIIASQGGNKQGAPMQGTPPQDDYLSEYLYRPVARAAKSVAKGFGSIPDLVNLPINTAAAFMGAPQLPSVSQNVGQYFDEASGGLTVPRNNFEDIIDTAGEFVAGGGPYSLAAKGAKLSQLPKSAEALGKLSPQNLGELMSFAGAGTGFEVGKKAAPDSMAVPLLASLVGGVAPSAAQATAKVATRPIQSTQNALAKGLSVNPDKVKSFQESGLEPSLSNISDSRPIGTLENTLKEMFFTGTPLKKIEETNAAKLNQLGEGLTQLEAGEVAQRGLQANRKIENAEIKVLKDKMLTHLEPNDPILPTNAQRIIEHETRALTPQARTKFDSTPEGRVYQELSTAIKANNGKLPYDYYDIFRKGLDNDITTFGSIGNQTQGSYKHLRGAIKRDIEEAVRQKGPEALADYKQYNKVAGAVAEKNKRIVNGLIKNKTATETFKNIVTDLKVDAKKADTVLKTLNHGEKQVFSEALVKELGMSPQNEFTASYLATNFKKLEPKAQEVLLSPYSPDTQKQLRSIIDSIDAIKYTDSLGNKSRTAYTQMIGGFATGAGGALSSGVPGAIAAPILFLGAGRLISGQLFANPRFIKWLSEAQALKQPSQVPAQINKLGAIAQSTPQLANDIEQYVKSMEEPEVDNALNGSAESAPQGIQSLSDDELDNLINKSTPQPQAQSDEVITPQLLNKIAQVESGGNPNAKNPNSSASGLFQFTNGTWRSMVNKYGKEYGITLRDKNNPQASTQMAQLYLRDNASKLSRILGRDPSQGEVYATHFLGLGGTNKLIKNYGRGQLAAAVFPREAKANRSVFYRNGKPITIEELYNFFSNKMA